MKRGCTAMRRPGENGQRLTPPDSLGEKYENGRFGAFSKSRSIRNYRCNAISPGRMLRGVHQASRGLQPISGVKPDFTGLHTHCCVCLPFLNAGKQDFDESCSQSEGGNSENSDIGYTTHRSALQAT